MNHAYVEEDDGGYWVQDTRVSLDKECENRGFESVWYPEHTHIPASRRSPWSGGEE